MKYYAVIDTNVLVSAALKWDSVPGSIVELALEGPVVPLLNEAIVAEYREVLSRPKFHLSREIVSDIITAIQDVGIDLDAGDVDFDLPDPKDVVFYAICMEKRKTDDAWLVTGNIKHFPKKPYIVTPREMLDYILKDMDTE